MFNSDKQLADIRHKIATVKENRNNHFRRPHDILQILYRREMELSLQVEFLMQPTESC